MKAIHSLMCLMAAVISLGITSCIIDPSEEGGEDVKIEVSGVAVNEETLVVVIGETRKLTAAVSPNNATDKTVTWESSDTKVATVKDGVVTGVAAGTAKVTAAAGEFKATCEVTVVEPTVVATGTASVVSFCEVNIPFNVYFKYAGSYKEYNAGICYSQTNKTPSLDTDSCFEIDHDKDGNPDKSGTYTINLNYLKDKTTYYYVAYALFDGKAYFGEVKSFTTKEVGIGTEQMVDLGLSVKWAGWNIGATKPEEYGNYYAWGEVEPQTGSSSYYAGTYKYGNNTTVSRYCTLSKYGTVDGRSTLMACDDAANVAWGGNWRMPTCSEKREFLAYTNHMQYTYNGVEGWIFTSKVNGNSIFIPAAGIKYGGEVYREHEQTNFWTSTLHEDDNLSARIACDRINGSILDGAGFDMDWMSDSFNLSQYRYYGSPVRAVYGEAIAPEKYSVSTGVSAVSPVSAKVSVSVSPSATVTSSGVMYQMGDEVNSVAYNAAAADGTAVLKGLSAGYDYAAMAYAVIDGVTYYGNTVKFKTTDMFSVLGLDASSITYCSAVASGKITGAEAAVANAEKAEYGIAWRESYSSTEHKLSDYSYLTYVPLTPDADGKVSTTLSDLKEYTEYYYGAYLKLDGITYYSEPVVFQTTEKPLEEWVDLGLSVLWRSWDVGSTSPEIRGTHFAWGETAGKESYSGNNYKWQSGDIYTKYNETDGLILLQAADDAATQNVAGSRTATAAEWEELMNNVYVSYVRYKGEQVMKLTSTVNTNFIYMTYHYGCGYWTANRSDYVGSAIGWLMTSSGRQKQSFYRSIGSSYTSDGAYVRPVKNK